MRYLTKSRFKLALECPTKLFYTGKKEKYADRKPDDTFLQALAEGGFQVGELAKYYFPGGELVPSLDYDQAIAETKELMSRENAVIYEGAFSFENLFIRADIVVKEGNRLRLIEVKAKSFDSTLDNEFLNRNGTVVSGWKPYFYDVAFQKYVIENAHPELVVEPYLMMADRSSNCPTDGLNQKFRVVTDENGRKNVVIREPVTAEDLSVPILSTVDASLICDLIYEGKDTNPPDPDIFEDRIREYAGYYERDEKFPPPVDSRCSKCEFQTKPEDEGRGIASGFKECWKEKLGWSEADFDEPNILSVWNYHYLKKAKRFAEGRIKITDLTKEDIEAKSDLKPGITQSERQWIQVKKEIDGDDSIWLDAAGLREAFDSWTFPLHFIDFETSRVAIPFNRGMRPYGLVAFQFSHHIVDKDGSVSHAGEYLNTELGVFPNFQFARELKRQLENDNGTIFRYAAHENSVLNEIAAQIRDESGKLQEGAELLEFIRSITRSSSSSEESWIGERDMVDMWELVKRHYYSPYTNGSTSIKKVLPAIMNDSDFLQAKYSKPLYGSVDGITSFNFRDLAWVVEENGVIKDPYDLLPPLFSDISDEDIELLTEDELMKDGTAAMTAYARLQFEEMSDYERNAIRMGLLKYCELDTLAMVMIYEGWREMLDFG